MAKYDEKMTASQALEKIAKAFGGARKIGENELIILVDVITCRGTEAQKVDAFAAMPPHNRYYLPRMLILRNLWQKGDRFIDDSYCRERFSTLKLLNKECREMVRHFGELAVIDFLRPPALRARPAVGDAVAQL